MTKKQSTFVQGSLFEENYLIRTLGPLAHKPDIALTEIVANAWDAGASQVNIIIPDNTGQKLIVEDNGVGLSKDEFYQRWMTLGYDRVKHQGKRVEFPKDVTCARLAYGRNGIGRHGLLCFNNFYTVFTKKNGIENIFKVSTLSKEEPFVVQTHTQAVADGHGTRLEVTVDKNIPDPERILEIISARFLHDPQFIVTINGNSVSLEQHSGLISSHKMKIDDIINLDILFIDTQKAARSTLYQGIAFWQGARLVGEPTWILGNNPVIDGRTKFAKRYTVVVKTNDLAEYINQDWTGLLFVPQIEKLYNELSEYIKSEFRKLAKSQLDETKCNIQKEFESDFSELSPLGKYGVSEAIEYVVDNHPATTPEILSIAVEAVINIEKTRNGKQLLKKLSQLSENDIDELNRLLEQWTIRDALSVLDEIDKRISVIEAIGKLSSDSSIDELKILHPLVTEARWLFGPEFDSDEYISNSTLQTIAKKIFKIGEEQSNFIFENSRKRPDLFCIGDSTYAITGAEEFNHQSSLIVIRRILIIELKKGGSSISRSNRDQAFHYVEDFLSCNELTGNPNIFMYVVGHNISGNVIGEIDAGETKTGHIFVTTYSQLVDSASRRLFNLRSKLSERYQNIAGIDLAKKSIQLQIKL